MEARDLSLEDIAIGDTVSFSRTWEEGDVTLFAQLSGDQNPLHLDEQYAATTQFKKRLVHGMLTGSLCSRLVGMYLPGKRCLYLKQDLSFLAPVFIGDTVTVEGVVVAKSLSTSLVFIEIKMHTTSQLVLEGKACVQLLP